MYFDRYPGKGRELVKRKLPTGTARREYGRVLAQDYAGWNCAYCEHDLRACYESWLHFQVDHVVPLHLARTRGFRKDWLEDVANCVICCAACNAFLNRYKVQDPPPETEAEFFDLRDRVLADKKQRAKDRHRQEKEYWERNIRP